MRYDELKNLLESIERLMPEIDRIDSIIDFWRTRRSPRRSLHNIMWERATAESADFVQTHLGSTLLLRSKEDMWDYVIGHLSEGINSGLCLEFGVASGRTINYFSNKLPRLDFVGFDSFLGLKEDWVGHHAPKGYYSQLGNMPEVNANVNLIGGWFDETLPNFLSSHSERLSSLRFVHVDSDTYESAVTVLNNLSSHLTRGVWLLFDEFLGYPNWQNGEFRAWYNAEKELALNWRFRAFTTEQALIEIL